MHVVLEELQLISDCQKQAVATGNKIVERELLGELVLFRKHKT
jgi:hypothetical protein